MTESVKINAYAKINLYLDVIGKRQDGYHILETVMHSISLCDVVTVSKAERGIKIICSDAAVPTDRENTAYRCAESFFCKSHIDGSGVCIEIKKNIPSQAGLGGASADGAAALKGMNRLFGKPLTDSELHAIGAAVGADIPFCLEGGCAFCTGKGTVLYELPPLSGTVLIGKGKRGISTPEAYRKIDSVSEKIALPGVKDAFSVKRTFSEIAPFCRNIFDETADIDEVAAIKSLMNKNGSVCSCMTGSGSAVFGLYDDNGAALRTADILKSKGYFSALCSFVPKDCDSEASGEVRYEKE